MKIGRAGLPVLLILALGVLGCSKKGDTGPTGPQGLPGPSVVLGFASFNAVAVPPVVYNFGGGRTTAVAITKIGVGHYSVTFTGNYTGVTGVGDIAVLATISDTDNYHVASASMDQGSANATTIVVRVFVWSTATTPNPLEDKDFSVVVLSSKESGFLRERSRAGSVPRPASRFGSARPACPARVDRLCAYSHPSRTARS